MHMFVVCGSILWALFSFANWLRSRRQNATMRQMRSDQSDLKDRVAELEICVHNVREIVDQLEDTRAAPALPLQRARRELAVVTPIRTHSPRHLRKEPVIR